MPSKRFFTRFILLTYALSIPFWILNFVLRNTSLPLDIPIGDVAAAAMPLVAACLLAWRAGGKDAVKKLLGRLFDFKKAPLWSYGSLVCLPLVLYGAIYILMSLRGVTLPALTIAPLPALAGLLLFFYAGAIMEETGYTAYATDKLKKRYGAPLAALLIGIPWALWHVPSMIVQGRSLAWICWGIIGTIAFRYIYVLFYIAANRSVAIIVMLHTLLNYARVLFPHNQTTNPLVDHAALHYAAVAVFAIILLGLYGVFRNRQT